MGNETTVHAAGSCGDVNENAYAYSRCVCARRMEINILFVDGHVKPMQWKTMLGSDSDPNVVKYWTTAADPLG